METLDHGVTKAIFDAVNDNGITKAMPVLFGLIPYELYVIPGMYLAMLQVIWVGSPNPVQFHLLPHWFAYSVFQFMKKAVKRSRPGCKYKDMSKYIDASHCSHGHELQSFPSGHTGVAFALVTALLMELFCSEDPRFFEVRIQTRAARNTIAFLAVAVGVMVSMHRVSKGYHSVLDVVAGMAIGSSIGFTSWTIMEFYKRKYRTLCKQPQNKDDKECDNELRHHDGGRRFMDRLLQTGGLGPSANTTVMATSAATKVILTVVVSVLVYKFFAKDVAHLASIKH